MSRTVTEIFDGEVFRPTELVDLPADTEYQITIDVDDTAAPEDEFPLLKYLKFAQELDLPPDFAAQHDHYLHGTPKR